MSRMLDHLICGSTFGALHAAASSISGCRLIGVLGKGSSRTSSLAAAYGVPSITDINEVPRTSGGVASVALRSPSLGGDSVEVALSLAERGWNVLVEGPLSKNDITMIGKGCRKTRTSFMVANHYLNLPSTHAFKKAAKKLLSLNLGSRHLEIRTTSQVLFHALSAASELSLGGQLRAKGPVVDAGSYRVMSASFGRIPALISIYNEIDLEKNDFNVRFTFGMRLTTEAGILSMEDTGEGVTWQPSMRLTGVDDKGLPTADPSLMVSHPLVSAPLKPIHRWISDEWVNAIAVDITRCSVSNWKDPGHVTRSMFVAESWQTVSSAVGFPIAASTNSAIAVRAEDLA